MAICTICGFETEFMKQHMTNHGDERKFQCDKCEKVVTGRKALENHNKSHMSWNCSNCEEVIPHNSRSMHIKRCKKVSNTLSCEKCPYITNAKSNLNRHMKTHAIKEKPTFKCEKCGKIFQEKKYLNQHLKSHRKEFEKEFKCDECSKVFGHKHHLERHMKNSHEKFVQSGIGFGMFEKDKKKPEPKIFHCDQCNYSTIKAKDLEKHVDRKHLSRKVYEVYGKELSRSYDSLLQKEQSLKNWRRT